MIQTALKWEEKMTVESNKIKPWWFALMVAVITLASTAYFFINQFYQTGHIVELGKYNLGITIDKVNIDREYDTILADLRNVQHLDYIKQPKPQYYEVKRWFIKDEKTSIVDQMKQLLQDDDIEAWEIVVEGQSIGIVDHKKTGELILERVESIYAKSESEQLSFKETVSINKTQIRPIQLVHSDVVVDKLLAQISPAKTHTVIEGDTLWDIANIYGMPLDELLVKNPTMGDRIKPGDTVLLYPAVYTLNVISNQTLKEEQAIPFEVELVSSSSGINPRKGVEGKKEVTYFVEKENGVEVERTVLSEKIYKQPISQIEIKKERVQIASSNKSEKKNFEFIWPANGGVITSSFGMRNGKMHKGIDISGSSSLDIRAAYSGEVTFSGSRGTFGNLIIISHSNGKTTYYSHNEKNLVSVGDQVKTGDIIAKMGKTGNATGVVLHFEVREDGKALDPVGYVSQ